MTEKQNNELFYENGEETPFPREKNKDRTFINRYLREYRLFYKALRASSFKKSIFPDEREDESAIRAKMFEIKLFVASLPQGFEKMFLYYYYIKGMTMEDCAEALAISRRSVYRLKLKALDLALQNYKNL